VKTDNSDRLLHD